MRLAFTFLLISLFCLQGYAEEGICPNNGRAKRGKNQELVQCLPGQSLDNLCGEGYICYFTGMNYQCCPSGPENFQSYLQAECPNQSIVVLDANGTPVRCSTLGINCPHKSMFCNENTATPICCQSLASLTQRMPSIYETKKDEEKISESKNKAYYDNECPANTFAVLNQDAEPFKCTSEDDCPNGIRCLNNYCCELNEMATVKTQSPTLKSTITTIVPKLIKKISITTKLIPPSTTVQSISTAGPPAESSKPSAAPITTELLSMDHFLVEQPQHLKVHAVKSRPMIIHRPYTTVASHSTDESYEKISRKEMAQQFLLEQIKQGWPYDEKFYRPKNRN